MSRSKEIPMREITLLIDDEEIIGAFYHYENAERCADSLYQEELAAIAEDSYLNLNNEDEYAQAVQTLSWESRPYVLEVVEIPFSKLSDNRFKREKGDTIHLKSKNIDVKLEDIRALFEGQRCSLVKMYDDDEDQME